MAIATNHLAGVVRLDRGIGFAARTVTRSDNDNHRDRRADGSDALARPSAAFARGAEAARAWMALFGMASGQSGVWQAPMVDAIGMVNHTTIANLRACNAMTQSFCSIAHRQWLDTATRLARLADPFAPTAARERRD